MAIDREQILKDLHELGMAIEDLEAELKPLKDKRDRRIVQGLEMKIPEWTIVNSGCGITRGWIYTLRERHGLITKRRYNKSRSMGQKWREDNRIRDRAEMAQRGREYDEQQRRKKEAE